MISKNSGHVKWICRICILYHSSNTRDYVAKESSGHVVMPGYCGSAVKTESVFSGCSSVTSYFILPYNEF